MYRPKMLEFISSHGRKIRSNDTHDRHILICRRKFGSKFRRDNHIDDLILPENNYPSHSDISKKLIYRIIQKIFLNY